MGLREIELVAGGGSQAMIDAMGSKLEPERTRDLRHAVEQAHRVGAAADGEEHAGTPRDRAGVPQRATEEREERGRHGQDEVDVRFPRSWTSTATVSTWLVCGNISKVSRVRSA